MTKRRKSRSGRNQVIWDQAPHWGKKKTNRRAKRAERPVWGRERVAFFLPPQATARLPSLADIFPIWPRFLPSSLTARNEEGEGRVSSLSLSQPWLPRFFFLLNFLWAFERLESLSVTARIEDWPNYDCLIQGNRDGNIVLLAIS